MAKQKNQRTQIRLDPDNEKRLKEIQKATPWKPSISKLVNLLVRNHASALDVK